MTRFFVSRRYSGYRPVRWQCIKKSRPKGRPKRVILESFLDYGSTNWLYCKWELLSNAAPFRRFKIFCEFYTFASGKTQRNVI